MFDEKTNSIFSMETCFIFEPPKKLNKMYYRCQDKFELDSIIDMYDDGIQYGVCLISGDELNIYILNVNPNSQDYLDDKMDCDIKLLKSTSVNRPNSHNKGGQSAPRFGRINKSIIKKCADEFASDIVSTYMYDNHTKCLITKLIVAGNGEMKNDVCQTPIFRQHMDKYLFRIITINDMESVSIKNILLSLLNDIDKNDISKIDKDIDNLMQTNIDYLVFSENECLPLLECNKLKKLYVNIDMVNDDDVKDKLNIYSKKNNIIFAKSDKLRMYGGWIGIRLYLEMEIQE
jgi:peptide subunit release factor 1 (eRF1)